MKNYILWTSLLLSLAYSLSIILDVYIVQHVPEENISMMVDDNGSYYLSYGKGVDLFNSINGSVQTFLTLPVFPLYVWGEFGFAILMTVIGPILIFVSWLVVLRILCLIYLSLFRKSAQIVKPVSNQKLIILCIVSTILLSFIQFRFIVFSENALFEAEVMVK